MKHNKFKVNAFKRVENLQGMLDAATGRSPRHKNKAYLDGYAKQYALEAQISAQSLIGGL